MKQPNAESSKERLNRILIQDKLSSPERISEILRKEIAEVLSQYMNVENVKVSIHVSNTGEYEVLLKAVASRFFYSPNI